MKVKNIVRKAVALGAGTTLVATSIVGALAYDLSTYPAKYIVDGQFDGKIVVGEKAATADVLGSIDIAASLQSASVVKVPIEGAAGEVTLSGDNFKIETSSDMLELREPLNLVADVITDEDLTGLKSGKITTPEGSTNYDQYLRFEDAAAGLQNLSVNYVQDEKASNKAMGDYLLANKADPFLEWEIQFDEGFESEWEDRDATANGIGDLSDMEDRTFNIMGTDYTVVSAFVTKSAGPAASLFEMELMGGSLPDTLREGETKTYTIDGTDYEVTLVFVSDPNTGSAEAKFSVNGELTDAMEEGDTEILSGGLQIGVRDILVNAREGVASFYLGAHKVTITDEDLDADFADSSIDVNDVADESDVIMVTGSFTSETSFEITSIKYVVKMDPAAGGSTVYIPAGHGVRELVEEPELLLSDTLDIRYEGLTEPTTSTVEFAPGAGDDEYTLVFTNIDGDEYTVPFLSTDDENGLRFGDSTDNLVFQEPAAGAYNVGVDDYVIVTSKTGANAYKAVTNVIQYEGYDIDKRTVSFTDIANGDPITSVLTANVGNATGTIQAGGNTYNVIVDTTSGEDDGNVSVDVDGDGFEGVAGIAQITTQSGLVINPAFAIENGTGAAVQLATVMGTQGIATFGAAGPYEVTLKGTVDASLFDTANPETFVWTISETTAMDELDVDFYAANYTGPISGTTDLPFEAVTRNADDNVGMTDFGILVTETDSDDADAKTLTFEVPEEQRIAQVFLTMGSVTASAGGDNTADKVNPIAVGLAVLDTDADGFYGTENLIVVGGPCANAVAAELLGNPENCGEGFEPGKAVIQSFEKTGTVAILVAGYEATETLGASRVLASYKDYADKLKGTEVEVVVADLNDITVNPQ